MWSSKAVFRRFLLPLGLVVSLFGQCGALSEGKVGVIGATGRLGRLAVERLSQKGVATRVLLRHDLAGAGDVEASGAPGAPSVAVAKWLAAMPGVEMVQGDVTRVEDVEALLQGCSACIAAQGAMRFTKVTDLWAPGAAAEETAHAKQVNYRGVANIIAAAERTGCRRVVRVTGRGEEPWSPFSILINLLGSMAKAWNYEGEALLRASELDYVIVRPGVMTSAGAGRRLVLADDGEDLKVQPISHQSVADLCVDALDYPNVKRATLCAMTTLQQEGEASADDWAPLLAKVLPDRRPFPPTMFDKHLLAVRVGATVLAALGIAFTTLGALAVKALANALAAASSSSG